MVPLDLAGVPDEEPICRAIFRPWNGPPHKNGDSNTILEALWFWRVLPWGPTDLPLGQILGTCLSLKVSSVLQWCNIRLLTLQYRCDYIPIYLSVAQLTTAKFLRYRRGRFITYNAFYKQTKICQTSEPSAVVLGINVHIVPCVRHYPAIFCTPKNHAFFLGPLSWIQGKISQNGFGAFETCFIGSQMAPKSILNWF